MEQLLVAFVQQFKLRVFTHKYTTIGGILAAAATMAVSLQDNPHPKPSSILLSLALIVWGAVAADAKASFQQVTTVTTVETAPATPAAAPVK